MHRTLAETAAAELHQLILSGELPSGTPLRLEELATRLRMSQMPVREGLRRLETLGLVDIIPHRGAWVRETSLEDLRDTYDIRIAVETMAIRAAAVRFTGRDAELAREALDEFAGLEAAGDRIAARRAHTDFHFTLYRSGGSRWLPRAIEPLWQNAERYLAAGERSPEAVARQRREHEAILAACVAHDPDAADAALRDHLTGAQRRITDAIAR